MFIQPEKTLELYDLQVNQVTKGRGAYICDTTLGPKLLVPFKGAREKALYVKELLAYLKEYLCNETEWKAGTTQVEQILLTKDGSPLVEDEEENKYLLKDFVQGMEIGPTWTKEKAPKMYEAVELLAYMHLGLKSFDGETCFPMQKGMDNLQKTYERRCKEFVKVRNYVKHRSRKNDFEGLFLREYEHYLEQARHALEFVKDISTVEEGLGIIHGDFHYHNILLSENQLSIVNFENCSYGWMVADLVNLIRKLMEKNAWKQEIGMSLIEAYERIRPLHSEEKRMVYALFLFPEKFAKLINHYDNSNKSWISLRDIEKLRMVLIQEAARTQFLEMLSLWKDIK